MRNLKFICCQPATLYYARQVEVLINNFLEMGVKPEQIDIICHREGAIPKDGPSAGITMATAMTSALTGKPIRSNVAMTGEITLRGRVLPIGGLKEKILAASRYGIDSVIIPADNESDLAEIPKQVLKGITVHPVKSMDEVLELVLIDENPAA